eukprot:snap_masked-scaffold_42-processed-gene-0.27-mRNA-1 protein AED:1.00 eAED:1.00 QI:0/-1/0/0/-1/1/1/0/64
MVLRKWSENSECAATFESNELQTRLLSTSTSRTRKQELVLNIGKRGKLITGWFMRPVRSRWRKT